MSKEENRDEKTVWRMPVLVLPVALIRRKRSCSNSFAKISFGINETNGKGINSRPRNDFVILLDREMAQRISFISPA
ncbi:MAG: hypothetical protein EAZ42_03940 [Verrucomicrobia bacterium]|nr:MAG: hypothetical protein EAZ42_03940 [Verrucomicrobiota bacterium]